MKNRLGCLSVSGIVVAVVLLLGTVAWVLVGGGGIFSPGSLSAKSTGNILGGVSSHAPLGPRCDACHTAPWSSQTMADRCVACHADVGQQLSSKTGLHGKLPGLSSSPTCRGCHTDHHGPGGALTVVDEATFPHEATGYSLRGHVRTSAGRAFVCADCHPQGLGRFSQAVCISCHDAMDSAFMTRHEAAFGSDCLPCHDGTGRGTADFDHSRLPFKLTGAHVNLSCDRCHKSSGSMAALRSTPSDCYSCHAKSDRHGGRFGKQCGQCHSTAEWAGATFDHSVFPIDHGAEGGQNACTVCHPQDVSTYTCFGCHRHTPANVVAGHEGRSLAQLTNCLQCHRGGGRGGGGGGD